MAPRPGLAGESGNHSGGVAPGGHQEARRAETEVGGQVQKLLTIQGKRSVDSFHREMGKMMWDECGMSRNAKGLEKAIGQIAALEQEFWKDLKVTGSGEELNQSLEKAGRLADFFELAQLMCRDALERQESCGGHFREEHQTPEGEAMRNDDDFCYAAAWEYKGPGKKHQLHKEALSFEYVHLAQRSYK